MEDDIIKCRRIMKAWLVDDDHHHHPLYSLTVSEQSQYCLYPSSPVTVLLMDRIDINDCQLDLSLFKMPAAGSNVINSNIPAKSSGTNKRKRSEDDQE